MYHAVGMISIVTSITKDEHVFITGLFADLALCNLLA